MIEQYNRQTGLEVVVIGEDSNIFNIVSIVSDKLRRNKYREHAKEMKNRVDSSNSYHEALGIMQEYVHFA